MVGEKLTDRSLISKWTGASGVTDALKSSDNFIMLAIGIGETGSRIVAEIPKIGVKRIQTATFNITEDQIEEFVKGKNTIFIIAHPDEIKLKDLQKLVALAEEKVNIKAIITASPQTRIEGKKSTLDSLRLICQKCETVFIIDSDKLEEVKDQLPHPNVSERVIAHIIKIIVENISSPNLIHCDSADFIGEIQLSDSTSSRLGESARTNLRELMWEAKNPTSGFDSKRVKTVSFPTQNSKLFTPAYLTERITTEDYQITFRENTEQISNRKIVATLMMMRVAPLTTSRWLKEVQLFDLEPYSKSESRLALDLDLYQLEDF